MKEFSVGNEMHSLMRELFPLCRSLTGDGVLETLRILQGHLPLKIERVASGTKAWDWIVPDEWNITDAFIKDQSGNRVVDFMESNLHVMGYSVPFSGKLTKSELSNHIHTLPNRPDAIPYVTSYYNRNWGFCVSHAKWHAMPEGEYQVEIKSSLKPGFLNYGELVIRGESSEEILLSTNICHPSLANNELSGPIVTTFLAKNLMQQKNYYTYRIVYVPETIGAIVYLSRHFELMKAKTKAGYVVTCIGDGGPFSYLASRSGDCLTDRMTKHCLNAMKLPYILYDYCERGSDERQYGAPNVDLPIGSLMRTKYGKYDEYHSSDDNLELVTAENLEQSLWAYEGCLSGLEANATYQMTIKGEPQLGRRGLYPKQCDQSSIEQLTGTDDVALFNHLIGFCDGQRDLLHIAERVGVPILKLANAAKRLEKEGLLKKIGGASDGPKILQRDRASAQKRAI